MKNNALEVLTEKEWFDKFYPKKWGDWTKYYNAGMYTKNQGATGCTWMDYYVTGFLLRADKDGHMKVVQNSKILDEMKMSSFFIECGDKKYDKSVAWFIQPYYQPKNEKYYARVEISKVESNLTILQIYVAGSDDSSYTKHFSSYSDLRDGIKDIKNYGISVLQETDQKYFFTN